MSYHLPSDCLEIAGERLKRARQHIYDFDNVANKFLALNPYKATLSNIQPVGDEYIASYIIEVAQQVPINLRLIAGDAIHNLSYALNSIIWKINGSSSFPVYSTPGHFEEYSVKLSHCPVGIQNLIRGLQPYNYDTGIKLHPLRIIKRLLGKDKREAPLLLGGAVFAINYASWKMDDIHLKTDRRGWGIQNCAEIAEIASQNLQALQNLNLDFTFDIAFDGIPSPGKFARYLLTDLHDYVRDEVIARFMKFVK
jgi:hypothetical protein